MKYKYIGITKVYVNEKSGTIRLKDGMIIDECSIVVQNPDCFIEIKEKKEKTATLVVDKKKTNRRKK